MPITLDATSKSSVGAGVSSLTWSHTVGVGSNKKLSVQIQARDGGLTDFVVSSVTFNGESLSEVRTDQYTPGGTDGGQMKTGIWELRNPTSTTANIVVTFAGTVNHASAYAISLFGVEQSSAYDARTGVDAAASTPSVNITTVADNCWVVDSVYSKIGSDMSVGSGQTGISTQNGVNSGGDRAWSSYEGPKTPAGSVTMNYTHTGTDDYCMSVVSYAPASGGTAHSTTLTETVTIVDSIVKFPSKILTDAVTVVDSVIKITSKLLLEAIVIVDTVIKKPFRTFSEAITIVDAIIKTPAKLLSEIITVFDSFLFGVVFNGTSSGVRTAIWSNATNTFTMATWFQSSQYTQTRQPIMSNGSGASGTPRGYAIVLSGNSLTNGRMFLLNHNVAWIDLNFSVADNNLHHIVVSRQADNTTKVFLDGVLKYTGTPTLNAPNGSFSYIGKDNTDGVQNGFFKGTIFGAQYFDFALTDAQAISLYNNSQPTTPALNWYKFIDGQGSTATDSGTSPKNGTLLNATWTTITQRSNPLFAISKPLTQSITIVDSFIRSFTRLFTETIVIVDTLLKTLVFIRQFTETIVIVDTVLKSPNKVLIETIVIADTFLRTISKRFTEDIVLVDVFVRTISKIFLESISIQDVVVRTISKTFSESIILIDIIERTIAKTLAETFIIIDTFTHQLLAKIRGIPTFLYNKFSGKFLTPNRKKTVLQIKKRSGFK